MTSFVSLVDEFFFVFLNVGNILIVHAKTDHREDHQLASDLENVSFEGITESWANVHELSAASGKFDIVPLYPF